jgi:L-seryl-tRNA(Ser) seleniumtransferase
MASDPAALADLPKIDRLLAAADDLVARYGRASTTAALRRSVDRARAGLRHGSLSTVPDVAAVLADAADDLATRRPGPPRRVINATGVVLHTNLGRAPLSQSARAAVDQAAGYCDVELDLVSGSRGSRTARLDPLLTDVTGAEAGLAVNNAAAALVLALTALATGREVLVSRGELVEIGGSFRLPEIMSASGARLVEVGTTNKTRPGDFATAGDDVAAILAVHRSNYRLTGFTEEPELSQLATVAADRGVALVHDVGSGLLTETGHAWLGDEPSVAGSLAAGADLVLCSGDKLLGGPQAGLLVGDAELVGRCATHPLHRALRLDKLRLAALVATLEQHLSDHSDDVPSWGMLRADSHELRRRATRLAEAAGGTVAEGVSLVGGGAAPDRAVPGPVARLDMDDPDAVATRLRQGDVAVVARVADGALWVDPRTMDPADDELVAARIEAAAGS